MSGNSNNYYLGTSPSESLGNSPRYWYALRKNSDGEIFFVRSDQLLDKEAYELNTPGEPLSNFEDFEDGIDYFDGIDEDHELVYDNMKYPQYKWDNKSLFYYIDSEGSLIVRINRGYSYPTGISS